MVFIHQANNDKSYTKNSSLLVPSFVSFPNLKLQPVLIHLGELLAIVTIC